MPSIYLLTMVWGDLDSGGTPANQTKRKYSHQGEFHQKEGSQLNQGGLLLIIKPGGTLPGGSLSHYFETGENSYIHVYVLI